MTNTSLEYQTMTSSEVTREVMDAIHQLQKEVRFWRGLILLVCIVLVVVICAGSAFLQPHPDFVVAKKGFIIKDQGGRIRAVLSFDQERSKVGLTLNDDTGHAKVEFCLNEKLNFYGVRIKDSQDNTRMFTGFLEDQYSLEFYDQNKTNRLAISEVEKSGASGLAVKDEKGIIRLGLGQVINAPDGVNLVGMAIRDHNEKERFQLYHSLDDSFSTIRFMDEKGIHPRIGMGVLYGRSKAQFSMWGGEKQGSPGRMLFNLEAD